MAWWVVASIAGLSLVVVITGSMTPTIPVGGIAVSHTVSASDLRPGMIVTVPRVGADLPVTHRIVRIDPVNDNPAARSLTLRGDANTTDDPAPYVVEHAGVVLAHAPHVGSVLTAVTSAPARGLAVAVVGLLILWSFWPAPRRANTERERASERSPEREREREPSAPAEDR